MSNRGSSHDADAAGPAPPRGGSSSSRRAGPTAPQVDVEGATVISKAPPLRSPFSQPDPLELGGKLVGERLGHFELLELVGGGGMGLVYRAADTRLGRIVALKILASERANDVETVRRFRNEAQSAARLDHENIARVYDVGEDRGLSYIVFEYIDGVNIRDMVFNRGPLSVADALRYTLQVVHALAHAAGRDVVHRDIKPSNVLITPQGRAKLVDMGLARLHQVEHSGDLTASGVTLGTFDYISPEQARDPRNADVRSDIYSLGCTLYFMLTARPPFPDGNVLQKLLQHQGDAPPDPAEANPQVPEELSRIVRKMLAKDPSRRYQDPGELIAELTLLADRLGVDLSGVRGGTVAAQPSLASALIRQHLPWAVPLAALLGVLLLLDYFWSGGAAQRVALPHPPAGSPIAPPPPPEVPQGDDAGPPPPVVDQVEDPPPVPQLLVVEAGNPRRRLLAARGGAAEGATGDHGGLSVGGARAELTAAGSSDSPAAPLAGLSVPDVTTTPLDPLPAEALPGVLVVDPESAPAGAFATLKEACEAAQAGGGDIIELRYTGRCEQEPVKLTDANLTIRAGAGFRPVVVFRRSSLQIDPTAHPREMVSLVSSQLTLLNVALEMDLPLAEAAGAWSLFQLQRSTAELRGCTLTVSNASSQGRAYHRAAVFRVQAGPRDDAMADDVSVGYPASIDLKDTVARGQAEFLDTAGLEPLDFNWSNGLLAVSEHFFRASGDELRSGEMPTEGTFRIVLDHVTANVRQGFCLLTSTTDFPLKLLTDVKCTNSVLRGGGDVPLVEQTGVASPGILERRLAWSGSRNHYEGFRSFWRISQMHKSPVSYDYQAWQEFWGRDERPLRPPGPAGWLNPPSDVLPLHRHVAADYELEADWSEASDAGPIGLDLASLPAPPSEEPFTTEPIPAPAAGEDQ